MIDPYRFEQKDFFGQGIQKSEAAVFGMKHLARMRAERHDHAFPLFPGGQFLHGFQQPTVPHVNPVIGTDGHHRAAEASPYFFQRPIYVHFLFRASHSLTK